MSRSNRSFFVLFQLFYLVGRITAEVVQVPITADPIPLHASVTFTSIPTIDASVPLFQYATTNTSVGPAGTTFVFQSASYISPDPTCVTTLPVTITSAGQATSTTTKPYCAVVTLDNSRALACSPEVEDLMDNLWLQGSFKGVTEQPAAATLITDAWSKSQISKRGVESGAFWAIQALAYTFAMAVTVGKTRQYMFGHVPVWAYMGGSGPLLPLPSTSSSSTTYYSFCQTCIKNLTPLVPTAEYVVVPMTITPTSSTQGSTSTQTTSAGPLQTFDLGCLKDTAEDPNHMYFFRQDAMMFISRWCDVLDPYANEDHDFGFWDATDYSPVPRAESEDASGSTQVRMWMGPAEGVTIPDAKKADWKANCPALLTAALTACDKKLGNNNPQPMDTMYGGWVTSQGVQWRLQGQKVGAGNFRPLLVKPPGNVLKMQPPAADVESGMKWAKRRLSSSKKYVSAIVINLLSQPVSRHLSLYGFTACLDATDCPKGYVAAEWTDRDSPPDICFEPFLDFRTIQTNTSYGMDGTGLRFRGFGNQSCEFQPRSGSTRLSSDEGILKSTTNFESSRELTGDIVCRGGSRASLVGTCFAPAKLHSGTHMCPYDERTAGTSDRHGTVYKMMAECFAR